MFYFFPIFLDYNNLGCHAHNSDYDNYIYKQKSYNFTDHDSNRIPYCTHSSQSAFHISTLITGATFKGGS